LLVVFTFVALPALVRRDEDISFRPLLKQFSYKKKRVLYLISDILLILFFIFIAISASQAAETGLARGLSSVPWLRFGYVYLFMGFMMALTILPVIEEILEYWYGMDISKEGEVKEGDVDG
jgi:TRAP-type C4-dicarboxylate transport system permease small subunit